jgi:hypothetical protein
MKKLRMAAVLLAATLVLTGLASAQYRDGDDRYPVGTNQSQARDNGYQMGYRDGYARGRHEGQERDPNDYQTPDWRQATRGYQPWMGPLAVFQTGYRDGYRNGFAAGYTSVNRGWEGRDRDDGYYPAGTYYPASRFGTPAYSIGFQDGATVAREDAVRGKPYNPTPRGAYGGEDRGYRGEYGNKSVYQAQYASGYRAGYEANFGR